ncbi:tubulin polyglutamylase TTLL6 [Sceloporus undulatus]|uniref:tubulin polyglutamylase TTLL6 n=1 Tax=Sceloporus undulatus TaxID=8520 RepID=UPI001C4BF88B|nr:tubulin polyglutamylase TTLL6 [Sceloporus undulatus]XP_042333599.1 tubulin polyglutamylase TTLL6 [Sceloporus undulatus]XP_042333600.1 tubulin polyglutamylase TTLL6 [Sceloporus undulatus]XP_042333601.1 tubulin polyglutamylase TTLL6 [Sceloporus undulatus]XP_042333602.1 tubulin polyglutamylase TTLL6 [Sceloporus undulatus]XP_042333603.1 tubulin polyglutamylase TTLL6 [Sceloporus undulatus]
MCGLREGTEVDDWTLYWTDSSVSLDRVMEMKNYQKINHFPGMSEICRKDLLARNMGRMLKLFPKEFNFFPRTWCLPADYGELQAFGRLKKHKTYICKPDSGCQGRGIFITKTVKDIKPGEDMICQLYISKPFIIDGFKFDLRVYVLVTSCDPLRVFVYNEGLARFATSAYSDPSQSNLDDVCMHLTNYSINKHSANFVRDEDSGSKRKLSTFNKYMEQNGYETEKIWKDIEDVVIKTLISAHPIIKHNYLTCFPNHTMWSACFEILGFDILLDRKLKPWLLEVNHSPSFSTDSWLDREVKDQLLYDTLVLINLGACDKRKVLEEEKRRGKERLLKQCRNRETRECKKASQPSAKLGSAARGNSPVCGLSTERAEENKNCQAAWLQQSEKYEENNTGGYRRIYPSSDSDRYDKFFQHNNSLFQETAASRAREEYARQLIQELRLKQEQKATLLREKKAELQGESSGEKIKIARHKVVSRTRMVRVSAQPQVCSESCPVPTFLPEHFSDVQQPEKKVDHGSNNCSEILEKLPVRPYSSVPDLSRRNSSNTSEQYNSTPELRDTISSHHSAPDMSVRSRLQQPGEFTKAHGKQCPCPHKHFSAMAQPRAKSVTATSKACRDGLPIKNFRPFEEEPFRSHRGGYVDLPCSAAQTMRIKLPEKEQDKRPVSEFFSKMNCTPVERNLRLLLQQPSHHFTNRAQSASLSRRILGSRSASCRKPQRVYRAHVPAERQMVEHHSLQDLLMISRMKNQPQRTNNPSLGDSAVNK